MINIKKSSLLCVSLVALSACQHTVSTSAMDSAKRQAYLDTLPQTDLQINIENAERLNHDSVALGVACSAHTYTLNLADDVQMALGRADKDGQVNNSSSFDVTISPKWARTSFKCVLDGVASGRCQSKTEVSGDVKTPHHKAKPFKIERSITKDTISCAGVSEAMQDVSQEIVTAITELVIKR